jgi:hypothetical protein
MEITCLAFEINLVVFTWRLSCASGCYSLVFAVAFLPGPPGGQGQAQFSALYGSQQVIVARPDWQGRPHNMAPP